MRTDGHGANRIFSSPLARRLAKEAAIDLARIKEAIKSGRGLTAAPAAAPAPSARPPQPIAPSDEKIRALFEPNSFEAVPHDEPTKRHPRAVV